MTAKGGHRVGTAIEDLLRLAWQADGDGKPGLRDALLTPAVVESGANDAVLAERCRRLLVARRSDPWFASATTLGQALAHTRVIAAVARLRATFPPVRVQRFLMRHAVQRGPYTGRTTPLAQILEDLALAPEASGARRSAARRDGKPAHALPFPGAAPGTAGGPPTVRAGNPDPDGSLLTFYLTVLLAMAVLVNTVIEPAARDHRAA